MKGKKLTVTIRRIFQTIGIFLIFSALGAAIIAQAAYQPKQEKPKNVTLFQAEDMVIQFQALSGKTEMGVIIFPDTVMSINNNSPVVTGTIGLVSNVPLFLSSANGVATITGTTVYSTYPSGPSEQFTWSGPLGRVEMWQHGKTFRILAVAAHDVPVTFSIRTKATQWGGALLLTSKTTAELCQSKIPNTESKVCFSGDVYMLFDTDTTLPAQ